MQALLVTPYLLSLLQPLEIEPLEIRGILERRSKSTLARIYMPKFASKDMCSCMLLADSM